jgi:hypothetical protein
MLHPIEPAPDFTPAIASEVLRHAFAASVQLQQVLDYVEQGVAAH